MVDVVFCDDFEAGAAHFFLKGGAGEDEGGGAGDGGGVAGLY